MSIKRIGTRICLNAENHGTHKTIPVREVSRKLNLLSLLFRLPPAFHKNSPSVSGPGAAALRQGRAQLTEDTRGWQASGSQRVTPSFPGSGTADRQLPPSRVGFPKLGGHTKGGALRTCVLFLLRNDRES